MCTPLWGKLKPGEYYGTYCIDIFPASKTGDFLQNYFKHYIIDENLDLPVKFDYLIMNSEDHELDPSDENY